MPVPDRIEISFDDAVPPVACSSIVAVDAVLDRLHADPDFKTPLAVAIDVFGHQINLGLGANPTFLCLQFAPCDGEYYLPLSSEADGEEQTFYGAGQDSYWQRRNLIPMSQAREAVRFFIEFQRGLPSIDWVDWSGKKVQPNAAT